VGRRVGIVLLLEERRQRVWGVDMFCRALLEVSSVSAAFAIFGSALIVDFTNIRLLQQRFPAPVARILGARRRTSSLVVLRHKTVPRVLVHFQRLGVACPVAVGAGSVGVGGSIEAIRPWFSPNMRRHAVQSSCSIGNGA
jgi:hypothetical protein